MKSLISIIIPVYNCEKYLHRCLDSILKQNYRNIEVLLVDDGSTDSSLNICKEYENKDNRFKAFHKKNGGPSSARNYGLDRCNGDYIVFVDSDDYLSNNYLQKLYDAMIENNAEVVFCGYDTEYSNKEVKSGYVFSVGEYDYKNNCYDGIYMPFVVWSMMINASCINNKRKKLRFEEDITYLEDYLFNMNLLLISKKNIGINDVLYHRVEHCGSLTDIKYSKQSFEKYFSLVYAFEKMCAVTEKYNDLHLNTIKALISSLADVQVLMKKLNIYDQNKLNKINELRKYYVPIYLKKSNSIKKKLIVLLSAKFPNIYCRVKG